MTWTVETVSSVDAEIDALPVKLRARLVRLLETVENVGLEALGGRTSSIGTAGQGRGRDRQGNLRDGGGTTGCGPACVFAKKSRKTPQRALATTRKRMKQVMP